MTIYFYGRWGMKFVGRPNYLSSRINFDGTDYGLIEIHEGVTISSYVRVLTHDWSLYTIAKATGYHSKMPIGTIKSVSIGPYSFVGTGSIIMPGAKIGRGCLIGAGTVVRGEIPDYSIVVGSPGSIVGDTREFIGRRLGKLGVEHIFAE
jgi:acetyltransferase-like isoleucine patch superfamily enzyme